MGEAKNEALKREWVSRLQAGRKVTIKWDAGGDETPVWVFVDGEEADWQDCEDLVDLVIRTLDLPNAGELFVEGGGELLVQDGKLMISHTSKHTGVDYDIKPGEEIDFENFDWEGRMIELDTTVTETVVLIP